MWKTTPTPLKVLFVHDRFGAFAGAESNVLVTARELRRRGHSTGLLHGPSTGKGESGWMEVFSGQRSLLDGRGSAQQTAQAIERFNPDVIYAHKMSDPEVLATLVRSEVPVVRMVHDHELYCMRGYKYSYLTRRICERAASTYCVVPCGAFLARDREGRLPLKWVSYSAKKKELELNRQFHRMVVATEYMKQELIRNGFEREKIEIHAPVPVTGEKSWQSSFGERNLIVYAGQIVRGKGVDVLLESLAGIRTPFECYIFGDGNHRGACEKLSRKLGLSGRVHFKGYVPPEEIRIYYSEASVAVMSSVWPEPFGAAGLEGMRYGLPVVAFDAGGIKEWLIDGQNGFLVPWMDRVMFARRLEELLGNKPLAREMGERGRAFIGENFEFSKYVDGLESLFVRSAGLRTAPVPVEA